MKRPPNYFIFLVFAMAMGGIGRAGIIVDYTHDGGFFASNAAAKSALEAAVADINAILDLNLGAITNDVTVGLTSGTTMSEHDFVYGYRNPSDTSVIETISNTELAANEFRLFVGMSNLTGGTLAEAGPGGAGVTTTLTVGSGSVQDAFDSAVANDQHRRGDGPVITSVSGSLSGGSFSFDLGPTIGTATFDSDTNNDTFADSMAELEANWHFDHTTSVEAGKSDFYSVALHETLHTIGYGGSETWEDLVSGTDWTGSEAIEEYGTGVGLISGDGSHLATGVMSTRLSDGAAQQAVMTGFISTGTRLSLTSLDTAILRDIGFSTVSSTVAVPEPSSLLLFGGMMFGVFGRRRVAKRL